MRKRMVRPGLMKNKQLLASFYNGCPGGKELVLGLGLVSSLAI